MHVKLYKSPWKAVKLMLLCSVFVFAGLFILTKPDAPEWMGWLSICFFGLGYPVGLFHLLDRRPQIIINEIGVFDRTTYKDFINWEVIRDAYPIDISGQKFVCLVVDEAYEPSTKKGKLSRSISNLSKDIGAQELNIALGQVAVDEIRLTEFIVAMINERPEKRKEIIKPGMLT